MALSSTIKGWLEDASGNKIAPSTQATEVEVVNPADSSQNTTVAAVVSSLYTDKAPLASPALTGTPTAPTAAQGTNTTQVATTAFVTSEIAAKIVAAQAMVFKGTLGTSPATVQALPDAHNAGDTYAVATAGTYAGQACEVGDLVLCVATGSAASNADWAVLQKNIDGAVTGPASAVDGQVAVFDQSTGKIIKDSGKTLGVSIAAPVSGTDDGKFLQADGTWAVPTDTDTHYTATIAVADSNSGTSDVTSATTNTTTFLNVIENGSVSDSVQVTGSGTVTVTAANGVVTISGADTNVDTVGIPVIENSGTAPSNLTSGGLFFRKAASA